MDKIRCQQCGDASMTLLYRGSSLPQFGRVKDPSEVEDIVSPLHLQSPTFLTPGSNFMEDDFSMDQVEGMVSG